MTEQIKEGKGENEIEKETSKTKINVFNLVSVFKYGNFVIKTCVL